MIDTHKSARLQVLNERRWLRRRQCRAAAESGHSVNHSKDDNLSKRQPLGLYVESIKRA